MSQKQKVFTRKQILVIFKIAFLEAMALSLIIPTIGSTGEIPFSCSNTLNPCPIFYDYTVVGNRTTTSALNFNNQNATLNPTAKGEFLVAMTYTLGAVISSVSDGLNTWTKRQESTLPGSIPLTELDFSIWTTTYADISGSTRTVKAVWNTTTQVLLTVSAYKNVLGIGFVNGTTASGTPSSISVLMKPTTAGSWFVGGTATLPPANTLHNDLSAGSGLTQRTDVCQILTPFCEIEGNVLDTNYPRMNNVTFAFTTLNSFPNIMASGAIEISPSLILPNDDINECSATTLACNNPNICRSINTNCQPVIGTVTLASGPNSAVNIITNTAYCTGVTMNPFTVGSGTHVIEFEGQYSGQSRNVTNVSVLIQVTISTVAPSTVFGAGQCATGGTVVVSSKLFFPTFGAVGASTGKDVYFQSFISNYNIGSLSGTFYTWIEITPQIASIQYVSWGAQSFVNVIILS